MNDSADKSTLLGYDVDLGKLFQILLERKRLILASILGAVLLAIVYLHIATYSYTATLMVSPVISSSDSMSSKLGGLSSLASLAGTKLPTDSGTQTFMLYQQGLYSRDVADEMARNPQIMHIVFRNQWDADRKQWIGPSRVVSFLVGLVKDVIGIPIRPWQPPSGALLQEYIVKNVTVDSDADKPIVTITYRDQDPQFAVAFLRELDRAVDHKLRGIAIVRANQYVGYLTSQLEKVTQADIRLALMSTLADQEKTQMMASATAPYAAQPFDLPSASRKPTNPKPFLVLAGALFAGGLLGVLSALCLPPLSWAPKRLKVQFWKRGLDSDQ